MFTQYQAAPRPTEPNDPDHAYKLALWLIPERFRQDYFGDVTVFGYDYRSARFLPEGAVVELNEYWIPDFEDVVFPCVAVSSTRVTYTFDPSVTDEDRFFQTLLQTGDLEALWVAENVELSSKEVPAAVRDEAISFMARNIFNLRFGQISFDGRQFDEETNSITLQLPEPLRAPLRRALLDRVREFEPQTPNNESP